MPEISRLIREIPTSPHRRLVALVDELRRKGRDVYNYTAGQPGLPPPREVIEEFTIKLLKDTFNVSRYVATQGLYELREAISEDLKKYGGIDVDPNNILVTTGGVEAVFLSLAVTTEPGDKVLLFDPCYSVYWGIVKYLKLRPIICPQTIDKCFQPDRECIEKAFGEGIKAVLFASPDNPTSRIIEEELGKLIIDLAVEKGVWVLYDEAYKHIIYEGSHVWLQKYSRANEVLVSLNSFSKDIAIPGFRLGYMYGPKEVINEAKKLKGYLSITAPVPSQHLALIALRSGIKDKYLKYALDIYRRRRDVTYEAIRKYLPEAKVWKPNASMYLFPDVSPYLERLRLNDVEFTYKLAEEKAVAILPGSAFGSYGKNHLRVTFVTQEEDRLVKGIEIMAEYIEELEKKKS